MPGFKELFTHLSLQRPGFDLMPVSVRLVVDKMTKGQVSYRVLQFFAVSIIPPMATLMLFFSE
jgi:hypothetical protein